MNPEALAAITHLGDSLGGELRVPEQPAFWVEAYRTFLTPQVIEEYYQKQYPKGKTIVVYPDYYYSDLRYKQMEASLQAIDKPETASTKRYLITAQWKLLTFAQFSIWADNQNMIHVETMFEDNPTNNYIATIATLSFYHYFLDATARNYR